MIENQQIKIKLNIALYSSDVKTLTFRC